MRVFLYEFVTGGGFAERPALPQGSLLVEGQAMWQAVYSDLKSIPGVDVVSTRDARLAAAAIEPDVVPVRGDHWQTFDQLANESDFGLLIAPEADGCLDRVAGRLEERGTRLLSPDSRFIRLAGDKTQTSDQLRSVGVSVPDGMLLHPGSLPPEDFKYPAVLKANDGAGSDACVVQSPPHELPAARVRIEQFVSGRPASVGLLCGLAHPPIVCPPMHQILSADGNLTYLGGSRIMDQRDCVRAAELATRAIQCLPPTIGYVGIDLVLSDVGSGQTDWVIEVNPRLTTSYIGLRRLAKMNLAEAMIQLASGVAPAVEFSPKPVCFSADGRMGIERAS